MKLRTRSRTPFARIIRMINELWEITQTPATRYNFKHDELIVINIDMRVKKILQRI